MTPSRATPKTTSSLEAHSGTVSRSLAGGTDTAWNDPRVNLLYADLAGLPPIQVCYGDHELFLGEIIEFAKRAKDAGVDVSLHLFPEGQHNFILGGGRVPEVDEAIQQMGQWLNSKLWPAARPPA